MIRRHFMNGNDAYIMTSETNPEVLAVCYAQGWCRSEDYMTKSEAAAVANADFGTVFQGNTSITHFDELECFIKVTGINSNAFQGCVNLVSIKIPKNVTSIGSNAFNGCESLNSIEIPKRVSSIGSTVLKNCYSLETITVDKNNSKYDSRDYCNAIVRKSDDVLLYGCKNTIIPSTVKGIGNGAFFGCSTLANIDIPNSVTTIGSSVFYNCSSLTSVTIPDSVTTIGSSAFRSCSSLTSITIPNGVTVVEGYTFRDCKKLVSVYLSSGLVEIKAQAFYGTSSLQTVTCYATTAPSLINNTFGATKTGGTLYVPAGSTGYDVWMGTGNYYLGHYNWTKVEIQS